MVKGLFTQQQAGIFIILLLHVLQFPSNNGYM